MVDSWREVPRRARSCIPTIEIRLSGEQIDTLRQGVNRLAIAVNKSIAIPCGSREVFCDAYFNTHAE